MTKDDRPSLLERLARRAGRTVPGALRLLQRDPALLRDWARHVRAVEESLGAGAATAYTDLVVAASSTPLVAGQLARELPDHMALVAPENRERYRRLLLGVIQDRPDAAGMVLRAAPTLLTRLDDQGLADFVAHAMGLHRSSVRKAESFLRMESGSSRRAAAALQGGTSLAGLHRMLTLYARAHCGASVHIRPGADRAFTDGRHLYLPERIHVFGDDRDAEVYRILTARAAGAIEFGTLDLNLDAVSGTWPEPREDEPPLERMVRGFPNSALARDLFVIIEDQRIEARVREAYPGIARRMDALGSAWRPDISDAPPRSTVDAALRWMASQSSGQPVELDLDGDLREMVDGAWSSIDLPPGATVHDSVQAVQSVYPLFDALLVREGGSGSSEHETVGSDELGTVFDMDKLGPADRALEARAATLLDKLADATDGVEWDSARAEALAEGESFEEISDFLERLEAPAGPARSDADDGPPGARSGRLAADPDIESSVPPSRFTYPEWDHRLDDHKPDWVNLTEYRLRDGDPAFVSDVWDEYGPMIRRVRRAFEALRPEAVHQVRGLSDGDELDIDAVVAARIAWKAGGEAPEGLYRRRVRAQRDVAVAFLVDMSSSTNELLVRGNKRIIDVEREALVVTAEAVHALGDVCAIYGYSGYGRDQVAFYVAKDFEDPFDDEVRQRIGRIGWKMENRDGAAIRHATAKLAAYPARVKLLVLLSDGKPLDCGCDHYADAYAQADTRMALQEARKAQVHPFCITVDPHGRDYLRWMYGEGGYTIIDRVGALPERLPAVYRRLTR